MKSTNIEQFSLKSEDRGYWSKTKIIIPGILLSFTLSGFTYFLHSRPGMEMVSISAIAIALGIALCNIIKLPHLFQPGIKFCAKKILKLAIIILGFKLNFHDAIRIGNLGVGITFVTISSTFIFTYWLGSKLGLNQRLIQLIAAGTSICGTSAIVATNAVIHASDEDTAYSIATVTIFSILAMLLYPIVGASLNLSPTEFGFWSGFSIQQTAHVIAASFHYDAMSADLATISKLSRVIYLVPIVILLGSLSTANRRSSGQSLFSKVTIPWFVLLFLTMSVINTYLPVAASAKQALTQLDGFLFVVAMAAMGLETKFQAIAANGLKPFYLAGLSWIFIATVSLLLVKTFTMGVQ
ncbi:MAG: YeiH family protein [Cyanobacteria bacterium P01_E01_bin.35]